MDTQDLANDPAARQRVIELERWTKAKLAERWHQLHPNAWTAHPVTKWRKDEIAWAIVEAERAAA